MRVIGGVLTAIDIDKCHLCLLADCWRACQLLDCSILGRACKWAIEYLLAAVGGI